MIIHLDPRFSPSLGSGLDDFQNILPILPILPILLLFHFSIDKIDRNIGKVVGLLAQTTILMETRSSLILPNPPLFSMFGWTK
jgi:hypothetical protein